MLRLRHDHAVDEDAGDLDLPRIERAALGDPLDLHDDEPARVARRHGDRQHFERQRLLFHGDVAVGIGGRAADDADVDRERAIEEEFLAVDLDQPDQVLLGAFVDLAAAVARIDERAESHAREVAGPLGRDVAEQMGDDALREIVGLDLVGDRETLQLRHQSPVPADHAPHQAFVAEVIEPAFLAVALACGIDQREIARLVDRRGVLLRLRQVERLQRHRDLFGETDADEAAGRDRVAVADEADRLLRADDLPAFARAVA